MGLFRKIQVALTGGATNSLGEKETVDMLEFDPGVGGDVEDPDQSPVYDEGDDGVNG